MINCEILRQLNTTEEQLIHHIGVDIREIFSTMVGVDVSPSKASETETRFKDCVSAMVGFAGNFNGLISINTPQVLAMSFTSQMLGSDIAEFNDDVHDALGEIANMIGGSFKHHFEMDGHEVKLSTPSVISGDQYVLTVGSLPDTLTLMFESAGYNFIVSLYLEAGN